MGIFVRIWKLFDKKMFKKMSSLNFSWNFNWYKWTHSNYATYFLRFFFVLQLDRVSFFTKLKNSNIMLKLIFLTIYKKIFLIFIKKCSVVYWRQESLIFWLLALRTCAQRAEHVCSHTSGKKPHPLSSYLNKCN